MFQSLSQREKILVSVFLGTLSVFVLYKYVILKQYAIYQEMKMQYQLAESKLTNYQNSVVNLAKLKNEQQNLSNELNTVSAPFHVDIFGGEHLLLIGKMLEDAGLKIVNTNPLKTDVKKDYYTQTLSIKTEGSYGGLQQFFYDLEKSNYAFVIKKFDIYPQPIEGADPLLAGLNYNKLSAEIIINVTGDKSAVANKPAINAMKFDIFKPTDADITKLLQMKNTINQQEKNGQQNVMPENQNTQLNQNSPSTNSTVTVTNTEPKKESFTVITKKPPQQKGEAIKYEFEKR